MPMMICPERNCPRRYGCKSALPHEATPDCTQGCTLQDGRGGVWSDNRKPCVEWRSKAYAEAAVNSAKEDAQNKRKK